MAICPLCKKYYEGTESVEDMDSIGMQSLTDGLCSECISDRFESDMARLRARRIRYDKELVTIGKADFVCSGYYLDGELYDEEVTMSGNSMVWLLTTEILEQIGNEIIRRIESKVILNRMNEIEQELPDSRDPASLRLERSELDSKLEALEGTE